MGCIRIGGWLLVILESGWGAFTQKAHLARAYDGWRGKGNNRNGDKKAMYFPFSLKTLGMWKRSFNYIERYWFCELGLVKFENVLSKKSRTHEAIIEQVLYCMFSIIHRIKTLFVRHWEKKVWGGSVGHVCLSFIILLATQHSLDEESMKMRRKKQKQNKNLADQKQKVKRLKVNHNYIFFISTTFNFGLCSIY